MKTNLFHHRNVHYNLFNKYPNNLDLYSPHPSSSFDIDIKYQN
jgi:hypothetical protein